MKTCLHHWTLILLLSGQLFASPQAASGQEADSAEMQWISRAKNLSQVGDEIRLLYEELERIHALPTNEVPDAGAAPGETILRERAAYFGTYFPIELDSLLCRLNSGRCTRTDSGANWTRSPDQPLTVPSITFERGVRWVKYEKTGNADLRAVAANVLGGCEAADATCEALITEMNPGKDVLNPSFRGSVQLPAIRLLASLPLSAANSPLIRRNRLSRVEATLPARTVDLESLSPDASLDGKASDAQLATHVPPDVTSESSTTQEAPTTVANAAAPAAGAEWLEAQEAIGALAEEIAAQDAKFALFRSFTRTKALASKSYEAIRSARGAEALDPEHALRDESQTSDSVAEPEEVMALCKSSEDCVFASGLLEAKGFERGLSPEVRASVLTRIAEASRNQSTRHEGTSQNAGLEPKPLALPPAAPAPAAQPEPPPISEFEIADLPSEDQLRILSEQQARILAEVAAPSTEQLSESAYLALDPSIGVLEQLVDAQHCGFRHDRTSFHRGQQAAGDAFVREICVKFSGLPDQLLDHGTHVSALISAIAFPANAAHKLRGVFPGAQLEAFYTPIGSIDQKSLLNALKAAAKRARVVNASFFYPQPQSVDIVADFIGAFEENFLVVAAAGNDGREYKQSCERLPACLDLPNVLSVAALDLSAEDPLPLDGDEKSDFGLKIQIGAPGMAVPSAATGDRVALFSGTSQATPLVSAAAALVFARSSQLTSPEQVRDRLIYTSDLPSSLRGKLFGGRLNISRALDLHSTVVTLRPGSVVLAGGGEITLPNRTIVRGEALTFLSPPVRDLTFEVVELESHDARKLSLDWVRRMYLDPASGNYEVFLKESVTTRLSRRSYFLNSPSLKLTFRNEGIESLPAGNIVIRLSDVEDFVSAMEAAK